MLVVKCTNNSFKDQFVYIVNIKLATDYSGVLSVTKVRKIGQPFMKPSLVTVD